MNYFKIFECCIPVLGKNRSVICDIQRERMYFIPNSLYEILIHSSNLTISQIKKKFNGSYNEIIDEYFAFLYNEELIFYCSKKELQLFPKIELKWDSPYILTNTILDVNLELKNQYDFKSIADEIEILGSVALQLRVFNCNILSQIDEILAFFFDSRLRAIEIIIDSFNVHDIEILKNLCYKNPRITTIILTSSPFEEQHFFSGKSIQFSVKPFNSVLNCGVINSELFSINIETFTEAQKHNTCLNRKISIDTEGYIRNCPSMKEHYGNIKDTTLQEALQHPDFKKYWFINKDQIAVCKDCEFRYICTDCRAYIENPEDMYSKPLKCGYNPYTCEWEEWSTNPLKQKAIDHYGMRELVETIK
jgi:SPASM domain peptide maturase of grasp-with-spasm system